MSKVVTTLSLIKFIPAKTAGMNKKESNMKKFWDWLVDLEAPGLLLKLMVVSIGIGVTATNLIA